MIIGLGQSFSRSLMGWINGLKEGMQKLSCRFLILQFLHQLNIIPAGVVQDGEFDGAHLGGLYAEFDA